MPYLYLFLFLFPKKALQISGSSAVHIELITDALRMHYGRTPKERRRIVLPQYYHSIRFILGLVYNHRTTNELQLYEK